MTLSEANNSAMDQLSNDLVDSREPALCNEMMSVIQDTVIHIISKIYLRLFRNVLVTIASLELGRIIAGLREVVPNTMIFTSCEPLNSGRSVPSTSGLRPNEENNTELASVSDDSFDSTSSYEIVFADSAESEHEKRISESEIRDQRYNSKSEISSDDGESTCSEAIKKVTFNLTPVVHTMVTWSYAYRAARRGPWEQIGRDRCRFKGRINKYDVILNPILKIEHRVRIWTERFS